ncbi:hypothetical protein LPB248_15880 [Flavobacterium sp. LPB0248]|uniref:hypothetical protein n=1 Tax=Flavobacterium sp. LPB0248 TaxID=2614441 RepID=UPI0015A5C11E|nr:hypothetical protein [Flavobacterium sp. LPB0248]QLC67730.1 hypothetical protein LPB248_15880 [Flavobacterium sp. LPB0248]
MTVLHVLVSIIGLFAIFTLPQLMKENFPIDTSFILDNARFNDRIRYGIVISIMILLSVQILFFVNVIYSLARGRS